jgi:serine/threonine-protein kinase
MSLDPLEGLSLELADERDEVHRRSEGSSPEAPLPRMGGTSIVEEDEGTIEGPEDGGVLAARAGAAFPPWLLHTAIAAACAVLLVVGLHLLLGGPGHPDLVQVAIPDPDRDSSSIARRPGPAPALGASTVGEGEGSRVPKAEREAERPALSPRLPLTEPEDKEPIAGEVGTTPPEIRAVRGHLPEWTRVPAAARSEDPLVVVRRFADPADGSTRPTINSALNQASAGTVELADDGPLPVDDLYISGMARVIRARRGYRPIIRIVRSTRHVSSQDQSAFVLLDRQSLTLEGVDLVVDARELSTKQTALFGCSGSDLTLRDCSITVINPTGARFTVVRQDPPPRQEPRRPSRIWLERTLVRGAGLTVADLSGGPVDLVLDASGILAGRADPPAWGAATPPKEVSPALVRVLRPEGTEEQRIFLAGALLSCPGPVIRCERPDRAPAPTRPLVVRADGSAIGRLKGTGILSLVTSTDDRAAADRQVVWWATRTCSPAGWGSSPLGRRRRSPSMAWRRRVPRGTRRSRGANGSSTTGRCRATRPGWWPPTWPRSSRAVRR